jgi:hypothetical protein
MYCLKASLYVRVLHLVCGKSDFLKVSPPFSQMSQILIEIFKISRFLLKVLWGRYTDYTVMCTFCAFLRQLYLREVAKL